MKPRLLFCILSVLSIANLAYAQNTKRKPFLKFTNISSKLGVPGEFIRCMIQDDMGFIWLGTDIGFKYFDGYRYREYLMEDEDLSITAMLEDRVGDIWAFAGASVLYHLDRRKDMLTRHEIIQDTLKTLEQLYGKIPMSTCLLQDTDQKLLISTYDGFRKYDPVGDTVFIVGQKDDMYRGYLLKGAEGQLLEIRGDGIRGFDSVDSLWIPFKDSSGQPVKIIESYSQVIRDRKGVIWVTTSSSGGLYSVESHSGLVTRYRYDPNNPLTINFGRAHSVLEDSRGWLWLALDDSGIDLFDRSSGVFHHYEMNYEHEDALDGKPLRLFEDRDGGIWISLFHSGIDYLGLSSKKFKTYQASSSASNSLNFPYIKALYERPDGNIWIATDGGGLNLWDRKSDTFSHFTNEPGNPNSLSSDKCWWVGEDKTGLVWIATQDGVLNQLDLKKKTFKYFAPGGPHIDAQGDLWLTRNEGIHKYDQSSGNFDLVLPNYYGMFDDKAGNYWIGTPEGSCKYDFEKKEFGDCIEKRHYWISEDSQGNFWMLLPTQGDTILKYNPNTQEYLDTVILQNSKDHMWNQMVIDDNDNVWLATNSGIYRYDPGEKKLNHFDFEDGLASSFFRFSPPIKTRTGELVFGSTKGFNIFHPDSLFENNVEPQIVITGLRIGNQEVPVVGSLSDTLQWKSPLAQHIHFTESVTLSHKQNDLSLEFTALNFDTPEKNKFKYQLKGFDDNWIETDANSRIAKYTNLKPGKYTFKVIGCNNDQKWNMDGDVLHIQIQPPWYWTWWSKTIYTLILIGSIFAFVRWRTARQRRKLAEVNQLNESLRQLDKLKDQFLANTSHELRTPLQGIIGLSETLFDQVGKESLDKQREDLQMIISSGKRLNSLVDDILDFSKLKNYDIELLQKPINIRVLADIILRNNAPLLKGKNLELVNNIPTDLPAAHGDENRLQQVFYNLVGNAIKFTETGEIRISAVQKNQWLEFCVKDTGIGIPRNKLRSIFQEFEQVDGSISREFAGTGLGLSISKQLVELHGGEMWVESEVGQGSAFFFTLPVSKEKATTLTPEKIASRTHFQFSVSEPIFSASEGAVRILVVDDEPINQQVLRNHLSGQGFHIFQAMNGEEAIQLIEESLPFDLVLLDVMMPRMSGYEVCLKIREKHLPSELPIIMVTAKNQLHDIVQGLSLGANDYLPKPFHKEELLARVKTQLDLHQINSITSKFVPNEFLHSLNRERITEVMLGDHTEQEVTVLFTDIRDYTSLSETMTPEQNFRFVNAFHGRMGPIIQKNEGFINQYLGDAIMAIFAAGPENAIQAAIDMQKRLEEYNGERLADGRSAIKMGAGLHTGPLIMGIIGDKNRMDAATIADTVNTASRIESLTKYYGTSILVSEDSLRQVKGRENFNFRYLGKVQVKGRKEPVGLYECYDGDPKELSVKKMETHPEFEKGLEQFFNRDFPEAAGTFNAVLKTNPKDQPARLFLNKSSKYTLEGVPKDWDGVEVMSFK